ncbi:MAG: class I SAM-dependent methyltransferase [Hamadaea sp.]|nr:class I SAM-dependent methyltransferase [Hamadaea sp.]
MVALPPDYDADPARFAANQATTRLYAQSDVHGDVARRYAGLGYERVADIGGGNGALARQLAALGVPAVVVDRARYVADAPRPAVRADAAALPFADEAFDGAAALWMLYHLDRPETALAEMGRVVRPGGLVAVCAPSRFNDPEAADLLPGWGEPASFDAENGEEILRSVFADVTVERWDAPLVHLPDRAAVAVYLRGRGLSAAEAERDADLLPAPLEITKRGMLAYARVSRYA